MRNNTFWSIAAIIIIVVGGYFAIKNHIFSSSSQPSTIATTTPPTILNTVSYSCDAGKSIGAAYSASDVALTLSDDRMIRLPQTQSGSGIRYESQATSTAGTLVDVVFSSAGNDAMLMENASTTYQNCLAGTITTTSSGSTFTDQSKMFSFSYPSNLSVTGDGGGYSQSWMANATTSGMVLAKINIPQSYAVGTNFNDAKVTIGTSADPSAMATCLTYNPTGGPKTSPATSTTNGTTYKVFQSSDAGAGNYYDTTSYRTQRNNQCYAIEYTIHYVNFSNFPKGTVTQFNEAALKTRLDAIAQSFTFLQ
jgi:membrane-bound inhibitor of C-type lysozyme